MNNQPSGLATHSVGGIYPLVLVGFGDDTWGIRNPAGQYWTLADGQQRFKSVSEALAAVGKPVSAPPQRANWYGEDDQAVDFVSTRPQQSLLAEALGKAVTEAATARSLLREVYKHERWLPAGLSHSIRNFLEA